MTGSRPKVPAGAVLAAAGVVLAAGFSRRMGGRDKLLLPVAGVPMVRRVVETAVAASLDPVVVVVGPHAAGVRRALEGLEVVLIENPEPEAGLSGSLRAGIGALPSSCPASFVLLGDMPWVGPHVLHALAAAFDPEADRAICVPVHGGRRGNPVLWDSSFFDEMRTLAGDVGARSLLERHREVVHEVGVADDGVLRDVDTPEAWTAATAAEAAWRP